MQRTLYPSCNALSSTADKTNCCGWLIATALAEAWDEASLSAQISA